jgi:ABC-type glycerol-3-phosphate transport system permease component
MDEQTLENIPVIPAHQYPLWIKVFGVGILIATLYSISLLPVYWIAAKNFHTAKDAFRSKSDDREGLILLEGLPLDGDDQARIKAVMPVEYWKYFKEVKQ